MEIGKQLLYLSAQEVEACGLIMRECIELMEDAYRAKSDGYTEMPAKPRLGDPSKGWFLEAFLANIRDEKPGGKWLGGCFENAERNIPAITGLIILNDYATCCPIAVMDCAYITGMRTAAVSGMALRALQNPEAKVLSILGCGLQGRTHLEAVLSIPNSIERVLAWGPRMSTAQRYIEEMQKKYDVQFTAVSDVKEAVCAADVLISSTPFGDPELFTVIDGDWFKAGVTVACISGANHFSPEAFYAFDKYYMDDPAAYAQIAEKKGFEACASVRPAEIGDVLTNKALGRAHPQEKILFNSIGIGINDMAAAYAIYERALKLDLGTVLPL
ncbi:MAG: ornithine cyclodeaminase family protein [Christensenellales bacterium]|jgi:ornithine cyclodeaminase/alanine dehydrogenase-like protein (mu-crystallin family)